MNAPRTSRDAAMTDAINHVATIFLISCVSRPRWASTSSIACRYSVSGVVELQCGARRKRDACRAGTGTFSGTNRGPWVRPPQSAGPGATCATSGVRHWTSRCLTNGIGRQACRRPLGGWVSRSRPADACSTPGTCSIHANGPEHAARLRKGFARYRAISYTWAVADA